MITVQRLRKSGSWMQTYLENVLKTKKKKKKEKKRGLKNL
jgi:hypothetical protein